jgi:hypothetical protein
MLASIGGVGVGGAPALLPMLRFPKLADRELRFRGVPSEPSESAAHHDSSLRHLEPVKTAVLTHLVSQESQFSSGFERRGLFPNYWKMDIPDARNTLQQASPTQHTQCTKPCVPTTIPGKAEVNFWIKGKAEAKSSLSPHPIHSGTPVNRGLPLHTWRRFLLECFDQILFHSFQFMYRNSIKDISNYRSYVKDWGNIN